MRAADIARTTLWSGLGTGLALAAIAPAVAADPERSGPSFDCRRASSGTERVICASPALSSLDGQIGRRYAALRKGLDKPSAEKLRQDQIWFIQTRDRSYPGASVQDRIDLLRDRLRFLNATGFSAPPGIEGTWRNAAGEVVITRTPSGRLAFSANAAEPAAGRWLCDVAGSVDRDGPANWTVTTRDPAGKLKLDRAGAVLQISEPAGRNGQFCGLNGSLAGSYFRTGNASTRR